MRRQERFNGKKLGRLAWGAMLAVAAMTTGVQAGPQDAQVVHGTAAIEQAGAVTNITTSQQAIINYSQFNIGSGETVNFIQPNAQSRVLNRINSVSPTLIEGNLNANGTVYFVNPQGVRFLNGAVVNVGGIYAAAGSISNDDFISGVDRFDQLNAGVVNEGLIRAGEVGLIGSKVINAGRIETGDGGLLTMVAGDQVMIARHGSNITVEVNNDNLSDPSGGVSLGAGDLASLAMAPTDPEAGSVVMGGTVEAGTGTGVHMVGTDLVIDSAISGGVDHVTYDASSSLTFDVAGTAVETTGEQVYTVAGGSGPINLKQNTTLNGSSVRFNGNIVSDTGGAAASLTVNGSADFNGTVGAGGGSNTLASVEVTGTTNIAGGSIDTTGDQDYRGVVNLVDDTTLTSGTEVHFHQSVADASIDTKGVGVGADLVVTAPRTYFDSRVSTGTTAPGRIVGSLRVNGETVFNNRGSFSVLVPSRITTMRDQVYNGPVVLTENVHAKSFNGDIRYLDTVDAVPSGIAGGMGYELPAGNGSVDAAGLTAHAINGSVQFARDVGSNGRTGLDYLIAVADPNAGEMITFGSDLGGNATPTSGTIDVTTTGHLLLNPSEADLTMLSITPVDGEFVTISPIPQIATIESRDGDVTLRSLAGTVLMGRYNKMTSLGDLNISATDSAYVGDLSAFEAIGVSAGSGIVLRTRDASNLYDFNGNLVGPASEDTNLDLVSNGVVDFNMVPTTETMGGELFIGSPLGAAADVNGTLGAFTFITQSRTSNEFFLASATGGVPTGQTLDLTPFVGGPVPEAFVLAGPLPFEDRIIREALLAPGDQQFLAQLMATAPRELVANEATTALDRIRIYNDGGGALIADASAPNSIVAWNRIRRGNAEQAIDAMQAILYGASGATATGEEGFAETRDAVAQAWAEYQQTDSSEDFVTYLAQSNGDSQRMLYAQLITVNECLDQMRKTGVTDLEYAVFANAALNPLKPADITTGRFYEMLTGRALIEAGGGEPTVSLR